MKLKCKQLPKNKDFSDTYSIFSRLPICKQFGPFHNNLFNHFAVISKFHVFTKKCKFLFFCFCWINFKSLSANFQWYFNFSLKRFLLLASLCVWPRKSCQLCWFPLIDFMMTFKKAPSLYKQPKIGLYFVLPINNIIVMLIKSTRMPHFRVRQLVLLLLLLLSLLLLLLLLLLFIYRWQKMFFIALDKANWSQSKIENSYIYIKT